MALLRRKRKGDHRYYLLPGMGRSNRRHRRRVKAAAIIFGLVVSILFALLIYLWQKPY
ncbi:MAG: hypothetical protein J7M29_08080 [Verrucomicrobia bacterium]|nr:hypothetical protein [Verrucomicrobiota bacterium]